MKIIPKALKAKRKINKHSGQEEKSRIPLVSIRLL